MRKTIFIRKGLAILLTAAMVAGLVPGMGTMQVSAAESDENTVDTVSSNDAVIQNQTDEQATDKCIITWQWIDEEENLMEETCNLALPVFLIFPVIQTAETGQLQPVTVPLK